MPIKYRSKSRGVNLVATLSFVVNRQFRNIKKTSEVIYDVFREQNIETIEMLKLLFILNFRTKFRDIRLKF